VSRDFVMARDTALTASPPPPRLKHLTRAVTIREFKKHEDDYRSRTVTPKSAIHASGALISGCRDDQTSMDGDTNGAFTAALLSCWDGGNFEGNHNDLHEAVKTRLSDEGYTQVPLITSVASEDAAYHEFLDQRPLRP